MHTFNLNLNSHLYRYSIYKCSCSDQYAVFLIGNLQGIESVDYFSSYFSKYVNVIVIEIPSTGLTNSLPACFDIKYQTRLVVGLLQYLNIQAVHVLSFSYATPVAIEFAKNFDDTLSLALGAAMAEIPAESRFRTIAIMADAIRDKRAITDIMPWFGLMLLNRCTLLTFTTLSRYRLLHLCTSLCRLISA